jgi:hypothetical protein
MKTKTATVSVVVAMFATMFIGASAFASLGEGGWVASGGGIFDAQKNPWFVRNTQTVHYCVSIDQASVSATAATVNSGIAAAFSYWRNELNQSAGGRQGVATIGTQTFVQDSNCSASDDIQFLIGYGALTSAYPLDQLAPLGDPQDYVGLTVRTAYDAVNLKGQGFVFIASDTGPHAYHNAGNLISRAWQYPILLQYALTHEVGHVMGIPHTGTSLMSEVFLNQMLDSRFSQSYITNPFLSFINPPMNFDVCSQNGSFNASFFGVDPATACLRIQGSVQSSGQFIWNISSLATLSSTPAAAGAVRGLLSLDDVLAASPAIVVQLPTEQTVFSFQDRGLNGFMTGPVYLQGGMSASFVASSSPKPNDVHVDLRTNSMTMVGVVNGKMSTVLSFNPPSLFTLPISTATH